MPKQVKYYGSELYQGQDLAGLQRIYNQWIKAANERIRVTTQAKNIGVAHAYEYKVAPLVGSKFIKEARKGSANEGNVVFARLPKGSTKQSYLVALGHLTEFLQSKTSTVQGMEQVRRERLDRIKGEYPEISDERADAVLRFLGSPEGQMLKKNFDSNLVKEALTKAAATHSWWLTASDILEDVRKWEQSGQTMADWIRDSEALIEAMEEM